VPTYSQNDPLVPVRTQAQIDADLIANATYQIVGSKGETQRGLIFDSASFTPAQYATRVGLSDDVPGRAPGTALAIAQAMLDNGVAQGIISRIGG
jgi:hypothetical protein